uniref:Uncharacterized protein n=1 Tax=Ursus americanus TaxID=9643 RepID=A0A452SA86_URSAM
MEGAGAGSGAGSRRQDAVPPPPRRGSWRRGISRAVLLSRPLPPGCGEPLVEKASPVGLNKGDGQAAQATARRGHCGDAETFPKMAAGARGRGWRGFRSRRGRGGAAGTYRSPWPPRRSPASPPRGRFHCRYNYAKLRIQERIARDGIKNKILYESTHLDPERKQSTSKGSS